MKKFALLFSLLLANVAFAQPIYHVCFTPAQRCGYHIVDSIKAAKHDIQMQAYSFTSKYIADALIRAQRRGVSVQVIIDKSELVNYSMVKKLLHAGVPIWVDMAPRIAHNKVMILDGSAVYTGSYNFTVGAEYHNAENLLYIRDKKLAAAYTANWQSRQTASQRLSWQNFKYLQKQAKHRLKQR